MLHSIHQLEDMSYLLHCFPIKRCHCSEHVKNELISEIYKDKYYIIIKIQLSYQDIKMSNIDLRI